ncbi:prepilin-type N-terminal cleavage/methylation domain-containing protein [Acinetobacter terrestris]|uniref:prepilin-type N-terminal cleavage/methylation domain-containing protein n=1 Tax=Acinetobacter terrestris TaxID=2529843 RepID=UPI001038CDFA|nr:prepilin-type N-terminal cleavage/methylation domain-containing protein [Acinetobacter terrestris]TCB62796.1 prepilin-type N-terminal cleavage/methylation domain-containing protein [Acinetobacter terrestris]
MNSLKFSQYGFTLIEILIALTLSIIIILAMLRAFVTTGKVTSEASFGAKTDSSIMLGLIATDRILQGVGYNINNPTIKTYKFSDDVNNVEYLVWKVSDNECRALKNLKVSDVKDGGLYVYGTDSSGYACDDHLQTPDLVNPAPSAERLIHIEKVIKTSGISDDSNKIGTIKIELKDLENERCVPFGIASDSGEAVLTGGKYQGVISINTYAASTTAPQSIRNVTCLFNLK